MHFRVLRTLLVPEIFKSHVVARIRTVNICALFQTLHNQDATAEESADTPGALLHMVARAAQAPKPLRGRARACERAACDGQRSHQSATLL